MEQKLSRTPVMIVTVILSVLAYLLRSQQLKTAFDEIGAVPGKGVLLSVVSLVVVVLFAAYARSLRGRKKYGAVSSRSQPLMGVACAAALSLLISSALLLVKKEQTVDLIIAVGGVLTAGCWVAVALSRYQGKRVSAAFFLIPTIFYVTDLICRFRLWTRDPVILDYCYDLFALICIMCAVFHLGEYAFDKGGRRICTFFSMSGVFFSATAMAGASAAKALGYLAAILWLMSNLWLLLRPGKKKQEA